MNRKYLTLILHYYNRWPQRYFFWAVKEMGISSGVKCIGRKLDWESVLKTSEEWCWGKEGWRLKPRGIKTIRKTNLDAQKFHTFKTKYWKAKFIEGVKLVCSKWLSSEINIKQATAIGGAISDYNHLTVKAKEHVPLKKTPQTTEHNKACYMIITANHNVPYDPLATVTWHTLLVQVYNSLCNFG